jgi:hypothetical protein
MNGKLYWNKLEMDSLPDAGATMHTVKLHIPFRMISSMNTVADILTAMRPAIQKQLHKARLHYSVNDVLLYETGRNNEVCYTIRCTPFETYEYRWWYYHRKSHNKYYDQLFGQSL